MLNGLHNSSTARSCKQELYERRSKRFAIIQDDAQMT